MFLRRPAYPWSFAAGFFPGGLLLALLAFAPPTSSAQDSPARLDYNFDVRPILSDRCFKCHGPDQNARKAGLRLDLPPEAAPAAGSAGPAIVPGRPDTSELVRRILSEDPDEQMPPPASNLALAPAEKALLQRWIFEGAEYKPHWSFLPIQQPAVPGLPGSAAPPNAIDGFILDRLARENLKPSAEARPETLLRRLSLDLRGLPPRLEDIEEFLHRGPEAYPEFVERFLASPAYGEHHANLWLDLARYADTYGYQADVDTDFSPWRDWVIRAFNENLPYDKFLVWQLAGDLLPEPTAESRLATAFNRLHRQTNEGGSVEEEFRAEYAADRVETMGTSMLGLTLGCARCHDHKYDPVSQKDFYRLFAFFNNIDESGLYSHFTRAIPSPTLLLYSGGIENQHAAAQAQVKNLEGQLAAEQRKALAERFPGWAHPALGPTPSRPAAFYQFEEMTNGFGFDSVSTNRLKLVDGPVTVPGKFGQAVQFDGDNSAVCQGAGHFNRTSPFSFSLWLRTSEKQERAVIFHHSRAWTDSGSRGYELVLEQGRPTFSLVHFWPGNAIKIAAPAPVPEQAWTHLAVTYDGSSRAAGLRLFINGAPVETAVIRDHMFKDIIHRAEWGDGEAGQIELTLAGRFRDSGFKRGVIDEFQVYDQCLTAWEIRRLAGVGAAEPTGEELREFYLARIDPPSLELAQKLRQAREAENALVNDVREVMVMQEMPGRRPTYLLKRGAYNAPGEEVSPGTPAAILAFPADAPPNRFGLAQWVVSPRNPLTARVAVNRVWRMHFGRGLVATEEDFGVQGSLPSHPELLDWLAAEFMRTGWDLKALHRLIVTSAVYRQTSEASPALLARDPENLLLARGPKHRLRAEEIRDSALAVGGLLSGKIGGPSVKPYQPEGLWEQSGTGKQYVRDDGEGLYRRSLYTFWRRTAPPPSMVLFDAPSREICTARRERTTTPLQALVLLNDPQFVEAARALAENALAASPAGSDRAIRLACRTVIGRDPRELELSVLLRLLEEQLELFSQNPAAAEAYLRTGTRPPAAGVPAPQLAAMTVVASALLNLDEFVMKR